jgi:predicted PurR-regulated permease PerM
MKTRFQTFVCLIMCAVNIGVSAQQPEPVLQKLQDRVQQTEQANRRLKGHLKEVEARLSGKLAAADDSIDHLQAKLSKTDSVAEVIKQSLGGKINASEQNIRTVNNKIEDLGNSLSRSTLYWIIAVLVIAILSLLLFALLRSRFLQASSTLSDSIRDTKRMLEEENVRLDTKLADILETQLQLLQREQQSVPAKAREEDHSLALKMADEINRIQKNISQMDPATKGLKQLSASVRRILESFEGSGYELVDLLNKPYDQGMKVIANFRPDEALTTDEQIITRIVRPQVNFNGIMIQAAEIEVSQGI